MALKINISTNLLNVAGDLQERLRLLRNPEYLYRGVCFDLIDLMTNRIHNKGIATDGTPIGQYSPAYLKYRQKKHNRTNDKKVVISLTRQLENDWSVLATPTGYGIGFKNNFNFDKSQWVEATYGKKIFSLSKSEEDFALEGINIQVQNALSGGQQSN